MSYLLKLSADDVREEQTAFAITTVDIACNRQLVSSINGRD
jgi:hypothetical protein